MRAPTGVTVISLLPRSNSARAQLLLELLDRHRQRRLAHEAALRRAAEAPLVGDGDDVAQLVERHRWCCAARVAQERREVVGELRVLEPVVDRRLEVAELAAAVVAAPLEREGQHPLLGDAAGRCRRSAGSRRRRPRASCAGDGRSAPSARSGRRRRASTASCPASASRRCAGSAPSARPSRRSRRCRSCRSRPPSTVITPMTEQSSRAATSVICAITGTLASIRSSASSTANGSSPTTGAAQSTAWPSPSASVCRM